MVSKKERLYAKLEAQQERINEAFEEKDQQFYAGPTCLFLVGLVLTLVLVGVLVIIVALVWALLRAGDKRTAEARYDAAVLRGQQLRDEYDELEE